MQLEGDLRSKNRAPYCTRKQILRLQDISPGSGLYFYLPQWQRGKITVCYPKGLRFYSWRGTWIVDTM